MKTTCIFSVSISFTHTHPCPYTNNYCCNLIFIFIMNFSIVLVHMYFITFHDFNFIKCNVWCYLHSSVTCSFIHYIMRYVLLIHRIQTQSHSKLSIPFCKYTSLYFYEFKGYLVYFQFFYYKQCCCKCFMYVHVQLSKRFSITYIYIYICSL